MANDNPLNKDEITQRLKANDEKTPQDFIERLFVALKESDKVSTFMSNPHYSNRVEKYAPKDIKDTVNSIKALAECAKTFLHPSRGPRP